MLREDFGRGDTGRVYDHLNYITKGVNLIGETWRGQVPQGSNIRVNNDQNYAPALSVPGPPYGAFTTMSKMPIRAATGRALVFPAGPYELGFQVNWDSIDVNGQVWCGIQVNATDSGSDYFGQLTGVTVAQSPPVPIRAGVGADSWCGVTAIARCQVELTTQQPVMFWLRHKNTSNSSTLDVRYGCIQTFAWATRLGH